LRIGRLSPWHRGCGAAAGSSVTQSGPGCVRVHQGLAHRHLALGGRATSPGGGRLWCARLAGRHRRRPRMGLFGHGDSVWLRSFPGVRGATGLGVGLSFARGPESMDSHRSLFRGAHPRVLAAGKRPGPRLAALATDPMGHRWRSGSHRPLGNPQRRPCLEFCS
jgi:hypothetical protein